MVILINQSPEALKVEYTKGNKSFFKHLPCNAFVAMDSLDDYAQISNATFLVNHQNVTILNYESGLYLNNGGAPTGATLPFIFIGNDVKPGDEVVFTATGVTAGYAQLKTMMS